jgi:ABC-type Fe3+/spermidine/putrescine transport system ATPase subunit
VNGKGGGMLSGTVREAVFLGESVRYVIDTDGLPLTAHVTGSRGRVAEGETVKVEWDPARVWILPDSGDREL